MAKLKYIISEKWNYKDIAIAVEFCDYCSKFFCIPNNVMITVKLVNFFHEDGTSEKLRKNRYELRVSGGTEFDYLHIIAHEFCHIWQMQDGRLSMKVKNNQCISTFDGVEYQETYDQLSYMMMPYEAEARLFEEVLKVGFETDMQRYIWEFEKFLKIPKKNSQEEIKVETTGPDWGAFIDGFFNNHSDSIK